MSEAESKVPQGEPFTWTEAEEGAAGGDGVDMDYRGLNPKWEALRVLDQTIRAEGGHGEDVQDENPEKNPPDAREVPKTSDKW